MLRFFVLLTLSVGCAHSASGPQAETAPSPDPVAAPSAQAVVSVQTPTERPPVWYLPPGRYQAHGARVTDGDRTVRLWGDWPVDVRADGARYHVELAIGGTTRTWTLVSRLELHVCANDTLQLAPDVSVAAGARLYLRGARPDDVTVSTSPSMPAPTYNVPLDAVSVDACPLESFTPEAVETEARDDRGLVVPAGTPIVSTGWRERALQPVEVLASWAFEAGPERWWLAPRMVSPSEAPTSEATTEATGDTRDAPTGDPREATLPKSAIRASIREAVPQVRACYESRLAMLPDLRGRLEVRFVILPSGEVGPVTTIESPGSLDLALEVCVTRVMKSLRFPPPNGGGIVLVTYPFVLAQRASASAHDESH